MDLEVNSLFPRKPVFKLSIKHTNAGYLRFSIHKALRIYETVYDRQAEHTVLLEINVIRSGLCSELLRVCCIGTNGHSIVAHY